MAGFAERPKKLAGIEYAIYTFDMPMAGGSGRSRWKKRDTRTEMAEALARAEAIFRTGKYGKVEVKQKYFDRKKNRNVDVTLRVYQTKGEKEINLAALFLFAFICAAAAFAATLLINN